MLKEHITDPEGKWITPSVDVAYMCVCQNFAKATEKCVNIIILLIEVCMTIIFPVEF